MDTMGLIDYYFNEGYEQPGCDEDHTYNNLTMLQPCELPKGKVLPGCSHKRSFKYFLEALICQKCYYIGVKAKDFDDLLWVTNLRSRTKRLGKNKARTKCRRTQCL